MQLISIIILLLQLSDLTKANFRANKQDDTTRSISNTESDNLQDQLQKLRNQLLHAKLKTRLFPLRSTELASNIKPANRSTHDASDIKLITLNREKPLQLEDQARLLSSTFRSRKGDQLQQQQANETNDRSQMWPNHLPSSSTTNGQNQLNTRSISNKYQQSNQLANSELTLSRNQRQKWSLMELVLGDQLDFFSHNLKQSFDKLLLKTNVSSSCSAALTNLTQSLSDQQMWAIQMLDSSAHRLPSGFLEGTLTELGHFDQCLSIKKPVLLKNNSSTTSKETAGFSGQYCSLIIKPPMLPTIRSTSQRFQTICGLTRNAHMSGGSRQMGANETLIGLLKSSVHFQQSGLRMGLCTPSACSRLELQQLLNNYLSKWHLAGWVKSCQVSSTINQPQQNQKTWPNWDQVQWSIVLSICALLSINIIATLCECYALCFGVHNGNKDQDKLQCFTGDNIAKNKIRTATMKQSMNHQHQPRTNRTSTCLRNKRLLPVDEVSGVDGRRWTYQVYNDQVHTKEQANVNDGDQKMYIYSDQIGHFHAIELEPQKNPLHNHESREERNFVRVNDKNQDNYAIIGSHPHELGHKDSSIGSQNEESWLKHMQQVETSSSPELDENKQLSPKDDHKCSRSVRYRDQILPIEDENREKESIIRFVRGLYQILICFGLMKNLRLTFGIHKTQDLQDQVEIIDTKNIPILDGIRTITMIWIIFGATFQSASSDMMGNLFQLGEITCSSRLLQALLNMSLAVETLFVVSGVLTITSLVRKSQGGITQHIVDRHHFTLSNRDVLQDGSSKSSSIGSSSGADHLLTNSSTNTGTLTSSSLLNDYESHRSRTSKKNCKSRQQEQKLCKKKNENLINDNDGCVDDPIRLRTYQPLLWLSLRYLRLVPSYGLVMMLVIVLPTLGSGPFWLDSMDQLAPDNCRSNWILNLLFINNHYESERLCLSHSWSLSNDMQFYMMGLILFGLYYHSMKRGTLLIWIITFAACTAANYAITIINQFPPTTLPTWFNILNNNTPIIDYNFIGSNQSSDRLLYKHFLYNKPWPHFPSYLIGLTIGYSLILNNNQNNTDSWTLSIGWRFFGWILSSLVALSLINSLYPWNMGLSVDETLTGIYGCTFRSLWALCLSWFIYELVKQKRNPLSRLLGWSGFQLPSRLTYTCYLVYPIVIQLRLASLTERLDFSNSTTLISHFLANVTLSYFFASLLAILLDSPIVQLCKLLIESIYSSGKTVEKHIIVKRETGIKSSRPTTGRKNLESSVDRSHASLDYTWNLESPSSLGSDLIGNPREMTIQGVNDQKHQRRKRDRPSSSMINDQDRSQMPKSSSNKPDASNKSKLSPRIARNTRLSLITTHSNQYERHRADEFNHQQNYDNNTLLMSILSSKSSHNNKFGRNNFNNNNYKNLSDGCSPDPDFQQKLAQAISKGFKLRNQMAMAGVNSNNKPMASRTINKTLASPMSNVSTFGTHLQKRRLTTQDDEFIVCKTVDDERLNQHMPFSELGFDKSSRSLRNQRVTTFLPSNPEKSTP